MNKQDTRKLPCVAVKVIRIKVTASVEYGSKIQIFKKSRSRFSYDMSSSIQNMELCLLFYIKMNLHQK